MKYLICGFSCVGKSTLLKQIQKSKSYPGYEFYDLDDYLLSRSGYNSVSELVESQGWQYFRDLEQKYLKEILVKSDVWVALGGGTLNKDNTEEFLSNPDIRVYWLDLPFEICLERIKKSKDRPMLKEGESYLRNLYFERLKLYSRFERINLDTYDL